jgi:hypothetical protein
MAANVLFQNQQMPQQQQGPYRSPSGYPAAAAGGTDQLQFYPSNYNQYDTSGGYRNSMQGTRMSGRSTPLAGYPEQYRIEGKMGWLAAFGTAGYPDGKMPSKYPGH